MPTNASAQQKQSAQERTAQKPVASATPKACPDAIARRNERKKERMACTSVRTKPSEEDAMGSLRFPPLTRPRPSQARQDEVGRTQTRQLACGRAG